MLGARSVWQHARHDAAQHSGSIHPCLCPCTHALEAAWWVGCGVGPTGIEVGQINRCSSVAVTAALDVPICGSVVV
jgi:hypothetical protein